MRPTGNETLKTSTLYDSIRSAEHNWVNQTKSNQIKPAGLGGLAEIWLAGGERGRRNTTRSNLIKPAFARSQAEDQGYSAEAAKVRRDRVGG
jgi:hypothetical protein